MARFENHRWCAACVQSFFPAFDAQTPAVSVFEAGKPVFRARRAEVVALGLGEGEKISGDKGADGMEAAILCAGPAEAVAVKASEGVGAAALEWATENVCAHDESFLGCRLCASAKTGE